MYTAILRSLLSYAVGIWFNPLRKASNISSLSIFQNKYLRLIGGAFKATPSFLLESELFLLPLDLYFKFCTACFLCHSSGPVAYLAQVTHLAGKSHLHCCLLAPLLPDPLPISFFSSSFLFFFPCLLSCTSIQVSSLKPSQVKVTESVRLKFCSAIALSHYERPTQP